MIKKLTLPITIMLILMLTSCKLVVEENKTTTTTKEEAKVIVGFMIEEYDENTGSYGEPQYYSNTFGMTKLTSTYFGNQHIYISGDKKTEYKVETDFYADLHRSNITYIITQLYLENVTQLYLENGELKKAHSTSGRTNGVQMGLSLSSTNNNHTTSHHIKFIDIDYLKNISIIQFDDTNKKIKEDIVNLNKTIDNTYFTLEGKTKDFIIIKKFLTHDNKAYEEKTWIQTTKILNNTSKEHYEVIFAIDELGNRYKTILSIKLGGDS